MGVIEMFSIPSDKIAYFQGRFASGYKILKAKDVKSKGSTLPRCVYALVEKEDGSSFIALMLYEENKARGTFAYKIIDETWGPVETDCPLPILRAASPLSVDGLEARSFLWQRYIQSYDRDYVPSNVPMDIYAAAWRETCMMKAKRVQAKFFMSPSTTFFAGSNFSAKLFEVIDRKANVFVAYGANGQSIRFKASQWFKESIITISEKEMRDMMAGIDQPSVFCVKDAGHTVKVIGSDCPVSLNILGKHVQQFDGGREGLPDCPIAQGIPGKTISSEEEVSLSYLWRDGKFTVEPGSAPVRIFMLEDDKAGKQRFVEQCAYNAATGDLFLPVYGGEMEDTKKESPTMRAGT